MSIVLNEREFAEKAILECTLGTKPIETLSRVAKYYKAIGFKASDITGLLEDFLIKCDPSVNVVMWRDAIERQVKNAAKYPLIELDSIPITQKELDLCNMLTGEKTKLRRTSVRGELNKVPSMSGRLLFTLIVLAKYANAVNPKNNGWVNRRDSEVFALADITVSVKRQALMYSDLRDKGYIRFSKKVDNINVNVQCLDYEGGPVIQLTDLRNIGNQYRKYRGEPYIECASCGLVIRRTGKAHRYCQECAAEINRIRTAQSYHMDSGGASAG